MKTILYFGLQASLVFAELAGVIGWSWWVVLLPLLIPAAFLLMVIVSACGFVVGMTYILTRKH